VLAWRYCWKNIPCGELHIFLSSGYVGWEELLDWRYWRVNIPFAELYISDCMADRVAL